MHELKNIFYIYDILMYVSLLRNITTNFKIFICVIYLFYINKLTIILLFIFG